MSLKLVSNNGIEEVHSVRIDGNIEVISVADGSKIILEDMEQIFPGFKTVIYSAESTVDIIYGLQEVNENFIWAHVSGKL